MKHHNCKEIKGIHVFLEGRTNRLSVGTLKKVGALFHFEYDTKYLRAKRAIPLGPEMPLTKKVFESYELFIPFTDRIPSQENPAYREYCEATGILPTETDPFILLATIAHKGPSSFIFEPIYENQFTAEDLFAFRKYLGLSVRDFAHCFEFSPAAVTRVELKQASGREILKRTSIYAQYPQVALDQIRQTSHALHTNKIKQLEQLLQNTQFLP
jgi:HipA-like protein